MNSQEICNALVGSAAKLEDAWMVKLLTSFFIAAIYNLHVQMLLAFASLVFVDLFTKWLALSKMQLEVDGNKHNLWQAFKNIPRARKEGYITSDQMKNRFVGKMFLYIFLVLCAGMVDLMLMNVGRPGFIIGVVVGYLSITEFLSIVENLQDAGVEEAIKLKEIIDKRGR
jgi:Holin family.